MNLTSRRVRRSTPRRLLMLAALLAAGASLARLDAAKARTAAMRPASTPAEAPKIVAAYGRLPLSFEPNVGQTSPQVKFLARGSGYGLYLTADQAVLALDASGKKGAVVRMGLSHANSAAPLMAQSQLPGKSNYFIGNDPSKWHRNIPQFARVRYHDVYPGIDLVYYGNQGRLEYDFEIAPGADPAQIALQFKGAEKLHVSSDGHVDISTGSANVALQAPHLYQYIENENRPVSGKFELRADNQIVFEIGKYDRTHSLVIDPVLTYSTYLGGSGDESCSVIEQTQLGFSAVQFTPGCPAIAVDSASRAYIAGATTSPDFPSTGTRTNSDVFVARLNASGSALDFTTNLGGSGTEVTAGIAVDQNFNIHVAGTTNSPNFPTLVTSYQPTAASAGTHAFVTEVAAGGASVLYSTYLSGTGVDVASGIALDNLGREYVSGTTTSPAFPTTPTALQATPKATNQFFFTKLDPTVTGPAGLLYSTYLGGSTPTTGVALGGGIAVDSSCNAYLTGGTDFTDMPVLNAAQGTNLGGKDAWVAKFSGPSGSACSSQLALTYLTYFGGSGDDVGYGIAVDSGLNAYITGSTASPNITLPTASTGVAFAKCLNQPPSTTVAYPAPCPASGTATDAFIAKFGSLTTTATTGTNVPYLYFTYLGGTMDDGGTAIAANSIGGALVTGWTKSADFPAATVLTGAPTQASSGGGEDAFLARIDTTTACTPALATTTTAAVFCPGFSTYLGGSGADIGTGVTLDAQNAMYITGETSSANFPAVAALQSTRNGPTDAFVTKLNPLPVLQLTATAPTSSTIVGVGNAVAFTYTLVNNGDPASNIIVTDTLPTSGATFGSISVSQGSCGSAVGTVVTCAVGALNSGASVTITANLTPTPPSTPLTSAGGISNSISASAAGALTQSVSNTATVHDFNIAVEPGTPSSVTVPAGVPANFTFQVTGTLGNYPNSISLSSPTGLPTGATATWTTNPIPSLTGGSQTTVLTITTTARVTTTGYLLHHGGQLLALGLPVAGVAFLGFGIGGTRSPRKRTLLLTFLVTGFFALIFLQAGCGSKHTTTTTTGTPAGTYVITVDATSGTATRATTVTLIVQ